jgi:hypothetical protein
VVEGSDGCDGHQQLSDVVTVPPPQLPLDPLLIDTTFESLISLLLLNRQGR